MAVAAGALLVPLAAAAQTTVVLPDTSQTTTLSVTVAAQARVTVPAGIAFTVSDVGSATLSNPATVAVDTIVLESATQQLRISLQAGAAAFTPPSAGATTWVAGDVSWTAATWTAGDGSSGTLSSSAYTTVATCDAGTTACSTTSQTFSLAPRPAVQRAGGHVLIVRWKVESIGS